MRFHPTPAWRWARLTPWLLCAAWLLPSPAAAQPTAALDVQPPLQAQVRTHASRFNVPASNAADIAKAVLPYAALATEVYCYLRSDESRPFAQRRDESCPSSSLHHEYQWQRLAVYPTAQLPPKDSSDRGLRFAVYYMDNGEHQPVTLAIAFRGTEFSSWSDWHSNLHWFMPGRDQYQVLRDIARQVIVESQQQVVRELRRPVDRWQIVTTGHSLGGGLAQLMAYKNRDVNAAVVFDPSPVTGFYTCVDDHEVNCNVPVWRVYASGEVLSYVRALMRKGYSLSENITEVEFSGVAGNAFGKHSMSAFFEVLRRAERHMPSADWPADGVFSTASDCACIAQRQSDGWQTHQKRCNPVWADLAPNSTDWQRAAEDALLADALQRRVQRLPPLAATQQVSQR